MNSEKLEKIHIPANSIRKVSFNDIERNQIVERLEVAFRNSDGQISINGIEYAYTIGKPKTKTRRFNKAIKKLLESVAGYGILQNLLEMKVGICTGKYLPEMWI